MGAFFVGAFPATVGAAKGASKALRIPPGRVGCRARHGKVGG